MPTFKVFKNKKTRKKQKRNIYFLIILCKNKILSGKAIMYGSVGCVFSPSIKCENF